MSKNNQKMGLGKGLSALFGEEELSLPEISAKEKDVIAKVDIDSIQPSRFQPRKDFAPDAIADLVSSIKEKGVLQPLLVRKFGENKYELIAGERRFRAAKSAGLQSLPVIVKDFDDNETLQVALIENLQRENLNPLEEAEAYQRLSSEFHHTQDEIAKVIGKSRSHITNTIRLLTLPAEVKEMVGKGVLTAGHARTLVGMDNALDMAKLIAQRGLNVREAEMLTTKEKEKSATPTKKAKKKNEKISADIAELEKSCRESLKTPVKIKLSNSSGAGKLTINFISFEQLDDLIQFLTSV